MLHTNEHFSDAIEAAVGDIEQSTDAELVIVAAMRSGAYRDVSLVLGMLVGLIALVIVLFVDIHVPPAMVPVDVLMGVVFGYLLGRTRLALRWLVPSHRKRRTVRQSALAEFVTEAVHATPQRSGVLVYVSALEGRVVAIPDVGIEGLVPAGEWRAATKELSADSVESLVAGLKALGAVLGKYVPPTDNHNRIGLDDAPRIRS
jgi:putative membrane protein